MSNNDFWDSSDDDQEPTSVNKPDLDDSSDQEQDGMEQQNSTENNIKEMLDKTDDDKPIFLLSQFPSEMEVKFTTEQYPIKVSENAFKVPSNFTRFGLSEVINQLIAQENDEHKHVPFEFLIEYKPGKKIFLRTSLAKFFTKLQIWPESSITLEYIEAQPAPKCVDSIPHDDWVSALSLVTHPSGADILSSNSKDNQYLVSGCYDGVVRVIDTSLGKIVHQTKQSKVPITSLATCYVTSQHLSDSDKTYSSGDIIIAGGGKDEFGRVWVSNPTDSKMRMKMLLNGHTDNVNDICLHPRGTMICTASEDRSLKLWEVDLARTRENLFYENNHVQTKDDDNEDYKEPSKKKKKMPSQIQQYACIGTLERNENENQNGHLLGINCVSWIEGGRIVSGSSDHTIRVWDVTTGTNSITLNGSKVVTSISVREKSESTTVLSSHPDFLIRMWDARQGGSKKASLFRSHRGWVRKVKWVSDFQFISGGDDNVVKLWDIRSGIPIHSTPHSVNPERKTISTDKVLSIEGFTPSEGQIKEQSQNGQSKYHLFSGSTDCTVKKHSMMHQ
ncbi:predicted protein [Naegleria gruberi]|uniref:Predicted protein n=1 Tax=Naegleria gruberi TaxID=5762 RepID=D2VXB2_NAEGR|nr:uncharacterized protein NAEGRDRAFT_81581 [Naegleria gruberi]EFC38644.1 predicted protein [Naegleria gruberi]|eukprot:XP_002671388.1 predicted protein [Naegleria gruberi strain NEG-M]